MNAQHPSEGMKRRIYALLQHNQDAIEYILLYGNYVEMWDDSVDEVLSYDENVAHLSKMQALGIKIYSHPYWLKYAPILAVVDALNNLTYFDSVKWESATEEWKRIDAKCLSHTAYNMLFAVLIIECGIEAARSLSLEFREGAHLRHLSDIPETCVLFNKSVNIDNDFEVM